MYPKRLSVLIFSGVLSLTLGRCGSAPQNTSQGPAPDAPSATPITQASPLVGFDKDLAYVKNGGYTYVFVFSRQDKKPLDKDDSAFLRTNAPQVVDWVITDGGKKVIAGTNFNLEEGNMGELKKRYVVEDYSSK